MKKISVPFIPALFMALLTGGLAWWAHGQFQPISSHSTSHSASIDKPDPVTHYHCPMHPTIIRDQPGNCPICGMKLMPIKQHPNPEASQDSLHASVEAPGKHAIHIDPTIVQNIGVETEVVKIRELTKEIRITGKLSMDETRTISINTKIMGWVEKLSANYLGKKVRVGEVLLEIYSPDWVAAQNEYLLALESIRKLSPESPSYLRQDAEDLLTSVRHRLENWGITPSVLQRLEREGKARHTLPFPAPVSGTVVTKNVVEGQNIMAGMELFRIADLNRMWALGEVYQEDLPYVKKGQTVKITLPYFPDQMFIGTISFIAPMLNPEVGTTMIRVELNNQKGLLKPDMTADMRLQLPMGPTLAVPQQAILRTGLRNIAILSMGNGFFEPREIKLGPSLGNEVQVLEGLNSGDVLVISSQFLIDSESHFKTAIMNMAPHPH